ncbi:MAG: tRNA 2-thiouridine(34) synthase MnmA [Planctomycetota bacterium]|nr:tRNA 2-thiouridine(34) synthase MnmA [Planctomycetota bacterium]
MASNSKSVLVAMSGGVDSSVAAALLTKSGCDVTGAYLSFGASGRAADAAASARRVAEKLGIELVVLDFADAFASIIEDFAAEYARGRTPNPCIHCNARIKFGRLIEQAEAMGIQYVATGHHARLIDSAGRPAVARGRARQKDQSYALFAVAREHLCRILLPTGEVDNKSRVRKIAQSLGLDSHDRPDSQEICFVADNDYVSLLQKRVPQALQPGDIVNAAGEVLGRHDGYGRFTVGQRRGLGVAAGEPLYVTRIDAATATVTIGPKAEVMGRHLSASGANWHCDVPASKVFEATVQVRYNHGGAPGRVKVTAPDTFEVDFADDVSAITPGQAAVIYDGDTLLGGGWID